MTILDRQAGNDSTDDSNKSLIQQLAARTKNILRPETKPSSKWRTIIPLAAASITAIGTLLTVIIALLSLVGSASQLQQQLKEQKKATSVQIVSDFMNEVGHGICVYSTEDIRRKKFDRLVSTRTQLLLDSLEFPELTSQIIQFLANNNYSKLFDHSQKVIKIENIAVMATDQPVSIWANGKKHYSPLFIRNHNLSNQSIFQTSLKCIDITCSNLRSINLSGSDLQGARIVYSDLSNSILSGVILKNAKISWVDFKSSLFGADITGAEISFSDLRNIRPANLLEDESKNREKAVDEIVKTLIKARSLFGSILDEDVLAQLQTMDGESGFDFKKSLMKPDRLLAKAEDYASGDDDFRKDPRSMDEIVIYNDYKKKAEKFWKNWFSSSDILEKETCQEKR